jgi:hypothetical protein
MKPPCQMIHSKESPKDIIAEDFKLELPISGGWGYSRDDACIITVNSSYPNGVGVEYVFVEKRIYEEMIIFRSVEEQFCGIEWNLQEQSLWKDEGKKPYDRLVFEITAFHSNDWDELKAEFEGHRGFRHPDFDIKTHEKKRLEKMVRFTREFWFEISSFY